MRILLDENLPRILKKHLGDHQVSTVQDMNWAGIENGKLLTLAQNQFDVFVTADRNLQYQNAISRFQIGLLVLRVKSTRVDDVLVCLPAIIAALPQVHPGQVQEVG